MARLPRVLPNARARWRLNRAIGKAADNEIEGVQTNRQPRMAATARSTFHSQIQAARGRLDSLNREIQTARDRLGIADAENQKAISKPGSEDLRMRASDAADRARNYGRVGLRSWRLDRLERQKGLLEERIRRAEELLKRNS